MDASQLLRRLGVTPEYHGFDYFLYALEICRSDPEARQLVTKWLYPDIAKRYGTTWGAVERSLRTAVKAAWRTDPALLRELAGYPLSRRPTPSQFLAILLVHTAE